MESRIKRTQRDYTLPFKLALVEQVERGKTTNSHHRFHRHPNLLKAGPAQIRVTGCEQVWVQTSPICRRKQNACT